MRKFIRWTLLLIALLFTFVARALLKEIIPSSALSGALISLGLVVFMIIVWKITKKIEYPSDN